MCSRPTEHREHRVTDELLACAFEALDGRGHRHERGGHTRANVLGIVFGEHPDVVNEVGEQRRDDTPVTALGRRGGICGCPVGASDWCKRRATARTEAGIFVRLGPARRTAHVVRRPQEIVRSGRASAAAARTLIRAATVWAIAVRACAAGPGSRWATAGTPTSPPCRTVTSSGTPPRYSRLCCAANRSPPPRPKISVSSPQCGQANAVMFSTRPTTGTFIRWNMARALVTSLRLSSCGVVTSTAPEIGTAWASVSCASDVPG